MRLVLKSFSQEIDLEDLTSASNFLLFEEDGTGQIFRIPVPQETILALSAVVAGNVESRVEEPELDEPQDEPPKPTATIRKTLRQMRSEDEVPNL